MKNWMQCAHPTRNAYTAESKSESESVSDDRAWNYYAENYLSKLVYLPCEIWKRAKERLFFVYSLLWDHAVNSIYWLD